LIRPLSGRDGKEAGRARDWKNPAPRRRPADGMTVAAPRTDPADGDDPGRVVRRMDAAA
jgi:hypothetical protein